MFKLIAEFWCKSVHARPMWPIHGHYICPRCLRRYPVNWDISKPAARGRCSPPAPLAPARVSKPRRHFSLTAAE